LALTSPTGGGRSVGIVRLRTKATEFFFFGVTKCSLKILRNVKKVCQNIITDIRIVYIHSGPKI